MITKAAGARLSLLALSALMWAGCESGPQVRSVSEPGANLSSYRTYSFAAQPGTNRGGNVTPLTTFFETAIAREMNARGYQQVEGLVGNYSWTDIGDSMQTPKPMQFWMRDL